MPARQSIRAALAVALVLGLAGLLALKGVVRSETAGKKIGFGYDGPSPQGLLITQVEPGLPASRAGLRAGDRLLAVDGIRLAPRYTAYDERARSFERGRPAVFRVRRGGAVLDLRVIPGVPPRWGAFLFEAFTSLCLLAVALLALQPAFDGDLRGRLLLGYATSIAMAFAFPQEAIGWPRLQIAIPTAVFLIGSLHQGLELHLAALITERPAWLRRRPWVIPLAYAAFLGLGLLAFATYLGERSLDSQLFPWNLRQVDALRAVVSLAASVAVVTLLAVQAFRHPRARGRNQARLVLAAQVFALLVFGSLTLAGRFGLTPPQPSSLTVFAGLGYCVAFFVAIFRYDLFDIEQVVRRSLIYTTLTTALVLVFYAALGAGGALLSYVLDGQESVWAVSLATLLLGLLFAPLRRFLHQLIDQRCFPERQALRQRLAALAGELPALGKLPRMGEHLVASLRGMFLTRSAMLLIADPETGLLRILAASDGVSSPGREESPFLLALEDPAIDHLRRNRGALRVEHLAPRSAAFAHRFKEVDPASLMVPLLNQEKLVGALIVGPKAVGSYSAEELELLNLLACHVAIVLENARLFESATYDSLTGLLRREAIVEQLERELERAQRYGRPLTVAVADLDYFKTVNDRYGHLAGDTLLRQVSRIVAGELRSTDWIGRYGGEEFLIVLPETDVPRAGQVAEKIRSRVQRTVVPVEDGAVVRVTLSIGLASLDEAAGGGMSVTARDLIAAADRSLYSAKSRGRNRVHPLCGVLEGFAS